MPGETSALKDQARRVKKLSLDRAEKILSNPQDFDKDLYNQTYLTALKAAIPQTRLLGNEDESEGLKLTIVKYGDNSGQIQSETIPNTDSQSV